MLENVTQTEREACLLDLDGVCVYLGGPRWFRTQRINLVRSLATLRSSTPKPSTEEALFAAIHADAANWQRLAFDLYHRLVHRLLLKSLGPNADVEDLVSDVFLHLFESGRNIRSSATMRSYVISITMNTIRHEIRRRKRRRLFQAFSGSSEAEKRPGTDDPKAKAALLQLSRILDEMNTGERLAFVLHSLEEMPIAEIATVLSVSHSTAKRRIRSANQRVLKRVMRNALLADYVREKAGPDE